MRRSQSGFSTPRWNNESTAPSVPTRTPTLPVPRMLPTACTAPKPIVSPPLDPSSSSLCFLVLFAKRSNKKRKSFVDGVLEINPSKLTLFDMDGKQMSQCRNTGSNGNVKVGDEVEVGANDVEISSQIPYSHFTTKQVFQKRADMEVISPLQHDVKPQPLPKFNRVSTGNNEAMTGRPAFNPDAPNALVLKPANLEENTVAIVVDPNLTNRLRPHQREGVQFLFNCVMGITNQPEGSLGCILADEMGLGKTLQSITLIWTLLKQSREGFALSAPLVRKCVIVCPANLVGNWQREFEKFLGAIRLVPICVKESGLKAEKDVAEFCKTRNRNVLIISYEGYRKHADVLNACVGFDLLIVDEGHRLKSSTGNKTITALAACPTKRRVLLTGTPLQNQLDEFYAVVTFVNPMALDGDVRAFRKNFQVPIEKGRDKDATPEEIACANKQSQRLAQMTQAFILRRTSEINQLLLPPKRETVVFIRLSAVQQRMYRDLVSSHEVQAIISGSTSPSSSSLGASGTDALRLITQLKQLCTHPRLVRGQVHEEDLDLLMSSSKFQVLDSMLQEIRARDRTDRIVLVSCYTSSLDEMAKLCDLRKYKYLRMDGKTKVKERQRLVNQFNAALPPQHGNQNDDDSPFVFLLSAKAGGCGINLVGGNRLVLMDADWNPAVDLQAMARVWRDGQTKHVHVYRFLSTGSIEERVFQRQLMKIQTASGIVGLDKQQEGGGPEFSRLELKQLFELHVDTKCDTFDLMREDNAAGWADYSNANDVQDDEVLQSVASKLGDTISFVHSNLFDANSFILEQNTDAVEEEESLSSESEEEKPRAKRAKRVIVVDSNEEEDEM